MKNSLVIMVGGASSRMKRSLEHSLLDEDIKKVAEKHHKSLIPLGEEGRPLLFYLVQNAAKAGITTIYLITGSDNQIFKDFIDSLRRNSDFEGLDIKIAIQNLWPGKTKPLGTADALLQCLEQYNELLQEQFTVCNGDNLYEVQDFKVLSNPRKISNALIAYKGSALGYGLEKYLKFALLDFNEEHFLTGIIEKPTIEEVDAYKEKHETHWVSMNIFNLNGAFIYPFLKECKIHPVRGEKELPEAVRNAIEKWPNSFLCIPRSSKIPDLTSAEDISKFKIK